MSGLRPCILLVVGLALVLSACGGSKEATAPARVISPAEAAAPLLLTTRYISEQVGGTGSPEAARTVLGFWRDIQFSNFPSAYLRLTPGFRRRTTYRTFVNAFSRALQLFGVLPRVQSSEADADRATVYLLLQRGSRPSPEDPPQAFNLERVDGQWRISTDPRNVLGKPPVARGDDASG